MDKNKKKLFYVVFFLFVLFIIFFMQAIIGPIIVAFLLSYLLDPVLVYFEKKNISRTYSALFVSLIVVLGFILTIWIFLPIICNQVIALVKLFPDFKSYLEDVLFPKIQRITTDLIGQKNQKNLHVYDVIPIDIGKYVETIFSQLGTSTKFVFSWAVLIVITPIFSFFFLRDLRKIYSFVLSLVPFELIPDFIDLAKELDKKLKSVITGQIIVISVLCVLYSTFLFIAGLPSAIAVGILTGLARFVPYLDTLVGSFLCFFVLVTNSADNQLIFTVCMSFLSVQCIDGLFITPRIMGKFSDLHPFLVLLSVICFGS
ncbi:MAG: AI-2E family transporter, partial [Bdellovibrionota bacterium]